jgi:solute carrier family 25, member 38
MSNNTTSKAKASKSAHPTFHFCAGLASGVSSAVLLQPADLLKTRVQQSRNSSLVPVLRSILSGPRPIASLWRGTVPSALRTGFGSALYFTSLNTLRQLVANNTTKLRPGLIPGGSSSVLPKLSSTQNLLTGASARVFAGMILMPVTVIKVRYESDMYNYKSLFSAIRSIRAGEGMRGFFSGFGATAVRDAPYAGLYVVFYEASKTYLFRFSSSIRRQQAASDDLNLGSSVSGLSNPAINAASGVMAGVTATTITNPFDAVKTRLQLLPQKYGNMLKATRFMLKEDGPKSFFDGLGLRMGRKAISSALAWTVYEELVGRAEAWVVSRDEEAAKAAL